jgi:hypothetical protein
MNDNGSKKVINWKLEIQHFDFQIEHIAGIKNEVADAFSRLVEDHSVKSTNIAYGLSTLHIRKRGKRKVEVLLREVSRKATIDIARVHNSVAGHHGVNITKSRLKSLKKCWRGMDKDISTFIKNCPVCQKLSAVKPDCVTEPFTLSCYKPMHRVSMDTIVKLPIDSQGNTNMIIFLVSLPYILNLT